MTTDTILEPITVPLRISPKGYVRYEVGHILSGETWIYYDIDANSLQTCILHENKTQWRWMDPLKSKRINSTTVRVWR